MEQTKTDAKAIGDNDDMLVRYQQLVEAAGDVIFTCDINGLCTYVNASVQRLFGYDPANIIGRHFTNYIHPDWRERVMLFYMQQFQDRKLETVYEFPAVACDGQLKWVEQVVRLQMDGDWVTGFSGFVRDMTRRKQAEDRLRAIIDAVPDHIYVKDRQHRFVLVNRATWENEGFDSAEAMLGMTDEDIYGGRSALDFELETRLLNTGEPIYNFERENPNPPEPGRREVVLINKVPLVDDRGDIIGLIGINRDITDRKQAENQMRESENTLRTLIETSTDLIFIKDRNLRYTLFNPAGGQLLNRSIQSVLGMTDTDLFGEEIGRETAEIDQRILETGEPVSYEIYREFPDKPRWLLISKFPFVSNRGGVMGIVGIGHDITERKEAEAALRESERRYRAVVDGQTELICRFDKNMILTFVNEPYCRYFGKSRDELIGQSFLSLIPPEQHEGVRRKVAHMLDDPTPHNYEHPVIDAHGNTRWQEWTDRIVLDDEGNFIEFQSAGRDITERKEAEAERDEYINRLEVLQRVDTELSQILKLESVLSVALDAAVRLSKANAGAIHLVENNQLKVAKVIGDYPESMQNSYLPVNTGLIGRAVRTLTAEFVEDVHNDPDYRANVLNTVAQITVPLISQDRLIGTLNVQTSQGGLFTDKTFDFIKLLSARIASALDNARLYQALASQYQQVSELEQLKTQLIHVAAHDIRGPLGVISGYMQLISEDSSNPPSERYGEYYKLIDQSVQRIDKISSDILTMERVERMQTGQNVERVDMTELVDTVFTEYEPQASTAGLDFYIDLKPEPALIVQGDRVFLRETVSNLISNAIKYTPRGGQVSVSLKSQDGEVIFEVDDTGYGIPLEQQADLFKAFYRVKLPETRGVKGSGLGLHLVRNIIERHNGEMIFRSVYGQGSTFGFRLPEMDAGIDLFAD